MRHAEAKQRGDRPERYVFDDNRSFGIEYWRNQFVAGTAHIADDPRVKAIDAIYTKAQTAWCAGRIDDEQCRAELNRFHREAAALLREIEDGGR